MGLELDENSAHYQIRAYAPGTIQINETKYHESLIITPSDIYPHWKPQTVRELTALDLMLIQELKPNILLIGTGGKHVLIAPEIYGELINLGIGVEIMNTNAACRTYNALSAENRNVAAALIIQ